MKNTGIKYLYTITILLVTALSIIPNSVHAANEGVDQSVGLTRTGVFHGQIGINGLKDMIYYLEKALEIGSSSKDFNSELEFAIAHAKKAMGNFEIAVQKASKSVGIDFSEGTKK